MPTDFEDYMYEIEQRARAKGDRLSAELKNETLASLAKSEKPGS